MGAAIGTRDTDRERVKRLVEAEVDVVVIGTLHFLIAFPSPPISKKQELICFSIDSSQGDSYYQIDMVKWLKSNFPNLEVIGGNIVMGKQAMHLIDAGICSPPPSSSLFPFPFLFYVTVD